MVLQSDRTGFAKNQSLHHRRNDGRDGTAVTSLGKAFKTRFSAVDEGFFLNAHGSS